jgi:hypothetical protein
MSLIFFYLNQVRLNIEEEDFEEHNVEANNQEEEIDTQE